jgi:hypothetical protein
MSERRGKNDAANAERTDEGQSRIPYPLLPFISLQATQKYMRLMCNV